MSKSNEQNYTISLVVDKTPEAVFKAIVDVRGWWSEEIQGETDQLGAEFIFHYKDFHRSVQKITEFIPGKKIVWNVKEAQINFVKNKSEWNNTKILFEMSQKNQKTELVFTHVGLVPAIECYNDCSDAWSFYIKESLFGLIMTGQGQANKAE